MPFPERNYRCDFSLPRYRVYVEVDGWQHHGKTLDDHHSDRERAVFFSARDWLPFRVSHAQAQSLAAELVDAIRTAMALRIPYARDQIRIETASRSKRWHRLIIHNPE
jgi:very-short-patch-repair endonuclease